MRVNPTSVRLGYVLSWPNKFLSGRSYNKQQEFYTFFFQKQIFGLFNNDSLKRFFLISQIKYHPHINNFSSLNIYIYSHKYSEISELLKRKKKYLCKKYLVQTYINHFFDKIKVMFDFSLYAAKLNFILVTNRFFKAELVSIYIVEQLANKFKLSRIIPFLGKKLIFNKKNIGLLVQCSGRFDRKERASYMIYNYGKINMNTLGNKLSYCQAQITLKYGVCGIKVWLYKK